MENLLKRCLLFGLCALLTGCASGVTWQTTSELTARSYSAHSGEMERSVGLLRRLLVLPVQFQTLLGNEPFFENRSRWSTTDAELGYSSDAQAALKFHGQATAYLSDWKGYETVAAKSPTAGPGLADEIRELADWAKEPDNYGKPTEKIKGIVAKLGNEAEVDGILIVTGVNKLPSDAKVAAVILSASLLWPILIVDSGITFNAAIFEAGTGKVVWRSTGAGSVPALLDKLEHAIPKTMTR